MQSNFNATSSCSPCLPVCDNAFDRVVVSYMTRGGTVIFYELKHSFLDPGPYTFTLQVGQSDNPLADDWIDVGLPVTNIFYMVDPAQRIWGKTKWCFYRIQLTTLAGTYLSEPTGLWGTLEFRWWRIARERLRQEILALKKGPGGQLGYLLKRRVTGTPCPVCLDPLTKEITNDACPYCFGTGFYCGYFYPAGCTWVSMSPRRVHYNQDPTRGTTADTTVKSHMANIWMVTEQDIWVNKVSDDRWFVHSVENTVEVRGVPISADVEMRLIPASSPIYGIKIPQQLESFDPMLKEVW
jgi:hypothetical protein